MSQSDEIYLVRIKIRMTVFLEVSFISARGTQKAYELIRLISLINGHVI